jgi:two-component system, response regulator
MSAGSGTILLVDDDHRLAALFVDMLRVAGIENQVAIVHDGVEALEYLFGDGEYAGRDASVMPRLVVLDMNMPRMNGLETLRRIRADERTKYLPVVMYSSSNLPQDLREAYDCGANGYVDKASEMPFPELVSLMARYWLFSNQSPLD